MTTEKNNPVGVIGSGSFGTAIAQLLSYNTDVLLYARKESVVASINNGEERHGVILPPHVRATSTLEEVATTCRLLFPVVPSNAFREMIREFAPFLRPYHIIIHATKGFDLNGIDEEEIVEKGITRKQVNTISELIQQESVVVRIGCLSVNLAAELLEVSPQLR
ncbi:MAG: NAD(P)-binding domain-containing protein [Saprospiraceae bacterium]